MEELGVKDVQFEELLSLEAESIQELRLVATFSSSAS